MNLQKQQTEEFDLHRLEILKFQIQIIFLNILCDY